MRRAFEAFQRLGCGGRAMWGAPDVLGADGTEAFFAGRATAPSLLGLAGGSISKRTAGGNPSTGLRKSLVERNDHLIRADQPEVPADQLVGHVGVGLARVEQRRMVTQLRFLLAQLSKLDLAFFE